MTTATMPLRGPVVTGRSRARPPATANTAQPSPCLKSALTGHQHRVVARLDRDPRVDAMSVAEVSPRGRRRREVDHDIDPLLLDAQRRDLGERGRLDEPDAAGEHGRAAAVVELDRRTRPDCRRHRRSARRRRPRAARGSPISRIGAPGHRRRPRSPGRRAARGRPRASGSPRRRRRRLPPASCR